LDDRGVLPSSEFSSKFVSQEKKIVDFLKPEKEQTITTYIFQ
jgi:hypothetical protein